MAFERISERKTIATNLSSFINSELSLIANARQARNLRDEERFQQAVMADNLTLEDQLKWREDQLKEIARSDTTERSRIKTEIASLKKRTKQKTFDDTYLQKLIDLNSGLSSYDSTLSWLKSRLKSVTDPDTISQINKEISSLSSQQYQARQQMLSYQTQHATESQTPSIINEQITRLNSERLGAIKAGRDDYVAVIDLQLQNLTKAKTENEIETALRDFAVGTGTGQSSISLLNAFNSKIEGSNKTTPVTIGGQRYDSEDAYWRAERNNYLNDRSQNGFFERYKSEINETVDYKKSKKLLSNTTMTEVKGWWDGIKDRPELLDYADRIEKESQKSLQYAGDQRAEQVLNGFAVSSDAQKAISDLAYLQDTFGIDQTANYQRVVTSAASEREGQVRDILSTMRQIMTDNPGISNSDALKLAVKSGAGATFSSEELATTSASDVITQAGDKATKEAFDKTDRTVVEPDTTKPFAPTANLREGELYKQPGSATVYKYQGGQLRPFTGAFDEASFKAVTGKGFADVQTVENVKDIPVGQAITKDDRLVLQTQDTSSQQNADGAYIPDPGLLRYYTADQIVTRGEKKFLKDGVKPVWGQEVSQKDLAGYDESKIIKTDTKTYLKQ